MMMTTSSIEATRDNSLHLSCFACFIASLRSTYQLSLLKDEETEASKYEVKLPLLNSLIIGQNKVSSLPTASKNCSLTGTLYQQKKERRNKMVDVL